MDLPNYLTAMLALFKVTSTTVTTWLENGDWV